MTVLVKKYPVFEDNQVLTSSQLNNLVEYLDQQNRLSRVSLIGVGILCGLELSCQSSASTGDRIIVSGGVGVTSEGYLIKMKECVNTKRRTYTLPENVEYPPFMDPFTDEQDVTLFEMLTDTADFDDQDDIVPLVKSEVQDMVVLLFVECLDKDLKSCLGKSCDQLGIDRFLNIRKLLVSRADYTKIIGRTAGGYQDVQFPDRFSLPKVVIPRTLFLPDTSPSEYYIEYSTNFLPVISSTGTDLIMALKSSYAIYEPILEPIYGTNPFEAPEVDNILMQWVSYVSGTDGSPLPLLGVQYFYDFIKDLANAYCEFRENACLLTSLCCPDMARFPKHLTLGMIDKDADGQVTTELRHQFTQPPVYGNQRNLTKRVIQLHQKLVALIETFDLDRLRLPNGEPLDIKITPSCEKKSILSERSIPLYYNTEGESNFEKLRPLEEIWTASEKSKFGRTVLSYDKHSPLGPIKTPVATPLDFDLDPYNFYRIEGHLGKSVGEAIEAIKSLRDAKNLSFDIKAVYLGTGGLEMEIPECLCTDLQTEYSIWRTKTLFFLKSLLALTTRIGNLTNKQSSISTAVFSDFQKDNAIFKPGDISDKTEPLIKGVLSEILVTGDPIKINPEKITNLSDFKLDVNGDNWHLAGKQIIDGIDRFKLAEKAPNDAKAFAAFSETNTVKGYFDFFNTCLCKLIDSMKLDLKDFDLEEWKEQYACTFQTHITLMKYLASQQSNAKASLQAYVILFLYCAVYKALSFLAIYPYITIGHIAQTLDFRKTNYLESFKFSNFLKKHPGARHKAGVAPGNTFLLLYLADEIAADNAILNTNLERLRATNEPINTKKEKLVETKTASNTKELRTKLEEFIASPKGAKRGGKTLREEKADLAVRSKKKSLFDLDNITEPEAELTKEEIQKKVTAFKSKVVGDFTLPYICCDDCSEMPNAPLPLNPLGLPVCGVVFLDTKGENEKKLPYFGDYKPLETKMVNYVYERETYSARIASASKPKYGTVEFKMIDSSFEYEISDDKKGAARKVQEMVYTVNNDPINKSYKANNDIGMVVDEFDYEFYNNDFPNKVICKSTITIFIPVISRTIDDGPKVATVTGRVFFGKKPLQGAAVNIVDTEFEQQNTLEDGSFEFKEVPEGEITLRVTHSSIRSSEEPASIIAPKTNVGNIITQGRIIIDFPSVDLGNVFGDLEIANDSIAALKFANQYNSNILLYKSNMRTLVKVYESPIRPILVETSQIVEDMADNKELNVSTLNAQFTKAISRIDENMNTLDSRTDKIALQEAMKNTFLTYLQRLSIEEPKEISQTTIKTTVKRAATILKPAKYPELREATANWLESSSGNITEGFAKSVTTNFKFR